MPRTSDGPGPADLDLHGLFARPRPRTDRRSTTARRRRGPRRRTGSRRGRRPARAPGGRAGTSPGRACRRRRRWRSPARPRWPPDGSGSPRAPSRSARPARGRCAGVPACPASPRPTPAGCTRRWRAGRSGRTASGTGCRRPGGATSRPRRVAARAAVGDGPGAARAAAELGGDGVQVGVGGTIHYLCGSEFGGGDAGPQRVVPAVGRRRRAAPCPRPARRPPGRRAPAAASRPGWT